MIKGLPPGFRQSIDSTAVQPVLLCHFHFDNKMYLLSDAKVGIADGLMYDYDPIIEDWGSFKDTANKDIMFQGNSLEIKQSRISIIITDEYKGLRDKALSDGIDNSIVEIYQWFRENPNEPPQLIDVMLAQDPITYAEKSILFSFDLVSTLMLSNPYLFETQTGENIYPIVVGRANAIPLIYTETTYWTTSSMYIDADSIGALFVEDGLQLDDAGEPGDGSYAHAMIDSEIVKYEQRKPASIIIVERGVNGTTKRPHYPGARVFNTAIGDGKPDRVFDYAICRGPVERAEALRIESTFGDLLKPAVVAPYQREVTFLVDQDPVIARFEGRPPWITDYAGEEGVPIILPPETLNTYGSKFEIDTFNATSPYNPERINSYHNASTLAINDTISGGNKAITERSSDYTQDNLVHPDGAYMKLHGSISSLNAASIKCQSDPFNLNTRPINGEKGSYEMRLGKDLSYLGDFVSASAIITFSGQNYLTYAGATVNVYENGTLFKSYTDLAQYQLKFATWNGVRLEIPLIATSWASLETASIKVEFVLNSSDVNNAIAATVEWSAIDWKINYYIPVGTVSNPSQELVSHYGKDKTAELAGSLSGIIVDVRFKTIISNDTVVRQEIVSRQDSDPLNNIILWSRELSQSDQIELTKTFTIAATDFAALANERIGLVQTVLGPQGEGDVRKVTTEFVFVRWKITYQPAEIKTPNENRVMYANDLVVDIIGIGGESVTPPDVLRGIINRHSKNSVYIDNEDFDRAAKTYSDIGFFFNGVLQGDIRLHDAIKKFLGEGLMRLKFSRGAIGIVIHTDYYSPKIMTITPDKRIARSFAQEGQPTSTIRNDITIIYEKRLSDGIFYGKHRIEDGESIATFDRQQIEIQMDLIQTDQIAITIAEYIRMIRSIPSAILSFEMMYGAYPLQKGDNLEIDINGEIKTGHIVAIDRYPGSGKLGKHNRYVIFLASMKSLDDEINIVERIALTSIEV